MRDLFLKYLIILLNLTNVFFKQIVNFKNKDFYHIQPYNYIPYLNYENKVIDKRIEPFMYMR